MTTPAFIGRLFRLRRPAARAAALAFLLLVSGPGFASAGEGMPPGEFEAAIAAMLMENQAKWDADILRALVRRINELPDPVASRALWMAVGAPRRLDTMSLFVAALASGSPGVRRQAGDLLVNLGTADAMRMVYSHLDGEKDQEVVDHIIGGIAGMPTRAAVRSLMEIMLRPNVRPAVVEATADRLRKATRANVSNNASAWRDWWVDNAHFYE